MPKALDEFWTDPLARAVPVWLEAETIENPRLKELARGDRLALAIPRVKAVFAGEVRWSEAGPGDRAVWVGRSRACAWAIAAPPQLRRYWEHLWDTITIGIPSTQRRCRPWDPDTDNPNGTVKMFGPYNIGAWHLCNLQCAGQLVNDHHLDVQQMYATADRPLATDETIAAQLIFGMKPVAGAHLSDLIIGHPVGQSLLPRENFSVEVTWYGILRPITVVVHLEGPATRPVQ